MGRYILIDLENRQKRSFEGLELLNEQDTVHILYSSMTCKMSMNFVERLMKCSAQIQMTKVTSQGCNAMDYRLVAILGNILASNCSLEYSIISEDSGYQGAIKIFEEYYKVKIGRYLNIQESVRKEDRQDEQVKAIA